MPSIQELLNLNPAPGAQQPSQPGGLFPGLGGPNLSMPFPGMNGATAQQATWKQRAQLEDDAMRASPYVLNPANLSKDDPGFNKSVMYPGLLQPGGVPRVVAGGQNIGQAVDEKAPGLDLSGVQNIDDFAKMLAEKVGISVDEAKGWIKQQIGNGQSASTGVEPNFQFSF